jgi:leader peptidase (prepilin peptidase)/N-methyltransferase
VKHDIDFREYWTCVVAGGLLAAAWFFLTDIATSLATFYLAVTMLLIMVIDARRFIIPDRLSLPAIPLGFVAALVAFAEPWSELLSDRLIAAATASGVLYAVRHVHWRWRGIEGLGLGDVKLAAAAGAWLGLANLAPACLLATSAALTTVLLHALFSSTGKPRATTRVPFGSFIAPTILAMWLWQVLRPVAE